MPMFDDAVSGKIAPYLTFQKEAEDQIMQISKQLVRTLNPVENRTSMFLMLLNQGSLDPASVELENDYRIIMNKVINN